MSCLFYFSSTRVFLNCGPELEGNPVFFFSLATMPSSCAMARTRGPQEPQLLLDLCVIPTSQRFTSLPADAIARHLAPAAFATTQGMLESWPVALAWGRGGGQARRFCGDLGAFRPPEVEWHPDIFPSCFGVGFVEFSSPNMQWGS